MQYGPLLSGEIHTASLMANNLKGTASEQIREVVAKRQAKQRWQQSLPVKINTELENTATFHLS